MLPKRGIGRAGNERGERENEKWEQYRELEMKLLIGLGFKVGFVFLFFIFPFSMLVPRCRFPVLATPVFCLHIKDRSDNGDVHRNVPEK